MIKSLDIAIPKEFYTAKEVMDFVYYAYKKQQLDAYAFRGLKFPATLEINLSHVRGDITVRYQGKIAGHIDLFGERITYSS